MVADVKIKFNTIEVREFIHTLPRALKKQIPIALAKVSAYGVKQITEKTQKGELPDGGRLKPYAQSTKKSRLKRGRQVGKVDLTDTGRMFRSLTSKITKSKGTLFFRRQEENKKAFFHDTGTRFMEARPFFAIGRRDEDKIRDIFFKAIKL